MNAGEKYYKSRLRDLDGRWHRIVVWDGVCDYENEPPLELMVYEKLGGKLGIVQINPNMEVSNKDALLEIIEAFDNVVLWARDHATYRILVDSFEAMATHRMQ
jgi:hypothetical protein